MFLFPYRLDANRNGLPVVTVLICLLCTFIPVFRRQMPRAMLE